jgi:xanthine dehydrogenase small subunit
MQSDFEFHINGVPHRAGGASASLRLLDYLRENMLTAAKDGCGDGGCGACSILLMGADADGEPALRVVNACLLTLPMVAGRQLWTAEALVEGDSSHPVVAALAKCAGHSCGYCLPGVSTALCEAYEAGGTPLLGDVARQTVGNLCRCTGYRPFRDALIGALRAKSEPSVLFKSLPKGGARIPPIIYRDTDGHAFYRPETLLEALRLRQAHPKAILVAGGTSRGWQESNDSGEVGGGVISLEAIVELSEITRYEDRWQFGAGTSIATLRETLDEEFPFVAEMADRFGGVQIRNRATIGGNLAAAAHHSDLVPVLLSLGASVRIDAVDGSREMGLDEFFVGFRQTALGTGEILSAITVPRPDPVGAGYAAVQRLMSFHKVSKRRYLDRAIANAAFFIELDGDDVVQRARLAFGGVAAYGARAYEAESMLEGQRWEPKVAQVVAAKLKDVFPASSDQRATAAYRNALVAGLWQKFFSEHRDPAKPVYPDASVRRYLSKSVLG